MKKCIEYLGLIGAGCVALLTLVALNTNGASGRLNASAAAITRGDVRSFLRQLRADVAPAGGARYLISPDGNSLTIIAARNDRADSVFYTHGKRAELSATPNPADFPILRRKSGEEPKMYAVGAVDFSFRTPGSRNALQIDLETEPPFPVAGGYERLAFHLTVHQK